MLKCNDNLNREKSINYFIKQHDLNVMVLNI